MPIQPPIPDFLRKKKHSVNAALPVHPPLPLLWALRLLVLGDGTRLALAKRRHDLDELLLSLVPDLDTSELTPDEITQLLKAQLTEQENRHLAAPEPWEGTAKVCHWLLKEYGISAEELNQMIVAVHSPAKPTRCPLWSLTIRRLARVHLNRAAGVTLWPVQTAWP